MMQTFRTAHFVVSIVAAVEAIQMVAVDAAAAALFVAVAVHWNHYLAREKRGLS